MLDAKGKKGTGLVRCMFDREDEPRLAEFKEDVQGRLEIVRVTIKGKCDGLSDGNIVTLKECNFVD